MAGSGDAARLAVVVTGASSGIGRAAAIAFACHNADVVLFARDRARLTETATVIHSRSESRASIVCGDVTSVADVTALAETALRHGGRIDVLIAAAGIGRAPPDGGLVPPPVAQMSTAEWDTIVNTNLTGTFLTNRAVLPAMIAAGGGDIVNVSSARAGRHGEPFASAYCASKFAIMGLSAALHEEAAAHGVRVIPVLPDATRTPMIGTSRRFGPAMSAEQVADMIVRLVRLPRAVLPGPTVVRHFERQEPR